MTLGQFIFQKLILLSLVFLQKLFLPASTWNSRNRCRAHAASACQRHGLINKSLSRLMEKWFKHHNREHFFSLKFILSI